MKGILTYLRGFLPTGDNIPSLSVKRNRDSDDDPPVMKKYKTVRSHFPKIMPSEEEEWAAPIRIGSGPRVHYIPVCREDDLPSTSTPTVRVFEKHPPSRRSVEAYDLTKSIDPSSTKSWKSPSLQTPTIQSVRSISKQTENPLFKLSPLPRSSNLLNEETAARNSLETVYQNRFFKNSARTGISPQRHSREDDADDPYKFPYLPPTTERKFLKPKNVPPEYRQPDNVIELSDSEDYDVILVKHVKAQNKDRSPKCNGESSYRYETLDDDQPGIDYIGQSHRLGKPRLSETERSFRRSISPNASRHIGRFKTPLSISKAKRLNSVIPFWKSQKSGSSSQTRIPQRKMSINSLPSTARAIIDKCIRLDEKKKYQELIKLSTYNHLRRLSPNKPSHLDLSDTQKRIMNLKSSIDLSKNSELLEQDVGHRLHNGTADKESPDEPVVVLSDGENDQVISDNNSTSSSIRIAPINSLRQSFREKPVADVNWIENLTAKYKNITLEKRLVEKDFLFITDTCSKSNKEDWVNKFQKRVKESKVYDLTDEPDELEEVALPELTAEQIYIIDNALRPNPPNQVLIEKFNLSIHRRDIQTLAGLNWLNDEVINFYMNLLMERGQQSKDLPKVYGMNTFFYPKLMQSGHAGLKRWTRKVDIFSHDLMMVPVHLGVHWCMSIIDFRKKSIKYFDSMGGKNMACCDALLRYLIDESMDKRKEKFDTSKWEKDCVKDIPQQMNGSDCGMFSCTFAEFIARDASITFSQSDMPYLRRKMILEIVQGKLLL